VYLGSALGLARTPSAVFKGPSENSELGSSVSGAGDVNGDGFGDVAIGIEAFGGALVYLGGASGLATSPSNVLATGPVASAGDYDGDGLADVVVGGCLQSSVGIYLGNATGVGDTTDFPGMTLPDVTFYEPAPTNANNLFGCSVASAGDMDMDGHGDILVGASGTFANSGIVYVYSYQSTAPIVTMNAPAGGSFGWSLTTAPVGGLSYSYIVGAPNAKSYSGQVYVFQAGSNSPTTTLTGLDAFGYFGQVASGG
jgi:hypothetical protein